MPLELLKTQRNLVLQQDNSAVCIDTSKAQVRALRRTEERRAGQKQIMAER